MKEIIVYLVLSSICIAIFSIVYRAFLRGSTSFMFNRLYLIFGLIASFVLPTIQFTYKVTLENINPNLTNIAAQDNMLTEGTSINIWMILFAIYILGVLVQLTRNTISYWHLRQIVKGGERNESDTHILIHNEQIKSAFSFYRFIVMNQKLSTTENELILKHEITHVLQKHWIDLLGCECALAIQWFNPFMWLYISYVKENHEFLADKAVLNQGVPPALYRAVLINQKFEGSVFSFSNSFNYSHKLNRLTMMKKTKTSSWRKVAVLTLIPTFGLFFWASATPEYIIENTDNLNIEQHQGSNKDMSKALIFIDGVESSKTEMDALDLKLIVTMEILKDKAALQKYGERGKNGVILITTENYRWGKNSFSESNK